MAVTLAVRFPHGRYHATAWDSAPNSGDVEWPPTPWRIARGLLSVWYTRMPHLDAQVVQSVIGLLREPPHYWLPMASPAHTRHYLPQADHRRWDSNSTTMTLDPSLHVAPTDEVLVHWPDAQLTPPVREALQALACSMPYLGRAESVCQARLLPEAENLSSRELDDVGWCRPDDDGIARVLCLRDDTTIADLDQRPDDMRAAKLLRPRGSRWVSYTSPRRSREERGMVTAAPSVSSRTAAGVSVIRWRLLAPAPFLATNGLLASEGLRASRKGVLKGASERDIARLTGHVPRDERDRPVEFDGHHSAHWFWLEGDGRDRAAASGKCFDWIEGIADGSYRTRPPARRVVRDVALWMPGGIPEAQVQRLARGIGNGALWRPAEYVPSGYVVSDLGLVGYGTAQEVLPELTSTEGAVEWVSATPFQVTRHRRKGQGLEDFIADCVRREWQQRHIASDGVPAITEVEVVDPRFNASLSRQSRLTWSRQYRHRRWLVREKELRRRGRMATYQVMLKLRFSSAVRGPIALGGLSHFGLGLFLPIGET